jgi:hypothetical protein
MGKMTGTGVNNRSVNICTDLLMVHLDLTHLLRIAPY